MFERVRVGYVHTSSTLQQTNNASGSGKAGMDALTVAAFEQRAAEAEARLSVLEAKRLAGALACAATVS